MPSEKTIEDILVFMSACRKTKSKGLAIEKPISFFSGAYCFYPGAGGKIIDGETMFCPSDATYLDIDRKIDLPVIGQVDDTDGVAFHRIRSVGAKSVRGKISSFRKHLVEQHTGFIDSVGSYSCGSTIYGSQNGTDWTVLGPTNRYQRPEAAKEDFLQVAFGIQFVRPFNWTVHLQFEGYPAAGFFTDPTGAREAFRLRDVPPGKKRRAALRNWVSSHMRKKRNDPGAETEVRKHLRGATSFNWNGLKCTITPSKDAQKENGEV